MDTPMVGSMVSGGLNSESHHFGLIDKGLSQGGAGETPASDVWILSSASPQPTKRGIWDDGEAWADTSIWLD